MALTSVGESHFVPDPVADPLSAMQHSVDQLIEIVDRYDLRANGDLLQALAGLRKRTATRRLTVAVFSGSSEDKSSLIRTLLNTTLENTLIPPSTAACTYFAYGAQTECAVTLANSMTAWLPLEQLAGFVGEKVPASNLKKILVRLPNAALEKGLVVIDTPELTGDPEASLSCTADAIAEADACVFVLLAREGLKENAIAFLRGMQGKLEKFFFVLDGAASLSGIERERSLERVKGSLEQRCGLLQPRVALLSAFSPGGSDAKLRKERSEACQTKLLGFASMSWQSLTSNEVARVAGETLSQADGALNLRETAPLERVRLRRVVKALDGISRQAAGLALASDTAMRNLVELPKETGEPASVVGASAVSGEERAPAAEAAPAIVLAPWGTLATTGTMPSFTGASVPTWVALPSAAFILAPSLPLDQIPKDTTAPMRTEPALREREAAAERIPEPAGEAATLAAAPPGGHESRPAETASARPVDVEPAARSFEWCANRFAFSGEDDEDEFASGGGRTRAWRVVGFVALLASLLVIAWAAVLVIRPRDAQLVTSRVASARRATVRRAERLIQSGKNAALPPLRTMTTAPVPAPPVTAQSTAGNPGGAAPSERAPVPPEAMPQTATPEKTLPQKTPAQKAPAQPIVAEAGLESALGRWIEASRSGDIQAQAACYAPVVATYFNSRNVTRRQVQLAKERASEGKAGVQNYHITTIGISAQGEGQRAVLLQKDWDTPTGSGPAFAGTEFERLVFAQVEGQWKIVGEQEVKLRKLHGRK